MYKGGRRKEFGRKEDASARRDYARNARIGGADYRASCFDCAHDSHGKVLVRCRCVTKPGVIGRIDEEIHIQTR